MKQSRSVSAHMSATSHVVGPRTSLGEARERMRGLGVQQLSVVDDAGQPCGELLARDLHIASKLGAAFDEVTVGALISGAEASEESTPDAADEAIEQEADATCIRPVQGRSSDGVPMPGAPESSSPEIASEQGGCSLLDAGYLLERVEDFAGRLLQSEGESEADELQKAVRELHDVQAALLAAERRELAETPPDQELHRTRLELLAEERGRHTQALATLLLELDRLSKPTTTLAGHALQVASALRAFIEREREPLRFVS